MRHDTKSRTQRCREERQLSGAEDERAEKCDRVWRPPPNLPQEVGRGGRRQEAGKGLYIDHTAKMGKLGQELKVRVIMTLK